jgi:hypothetical protein
MQGPAVSVFSLSKRTPPLLVTKELAQQLETHVLEAGKERLVHAGSDSRTTFSVEIHDDLGVEQLESISEMGPSRFSDSVKAITFKFVVYEPVSSIHLHLSENRDLSQLRISVDGPKARETAQSIYDSIFSYMAPHRTHAGWFHQPLPAFAALAAIVGLSGGFGLGGLLNGESSNPILAFWRFWLIVWIVGFSLMFGGFIKKYTAFDSRVHDHRTTVANALAASVFTAIVGIAVERFLT